MRVKPLIIAVFFTRAVHAQIPGGQYQASNLLNPNISVVGWIQAETGHRLEEEDSSAANANLKEVEIAFQAVVDPYSRADVFLAVEGGEIDLEEGTLTWFHLPGQIGLKIGKFKANLGKFNRLHTAETAFADRPLVHEKFFGEEGLSGTGGSLSWAVPVPFVFLNLDAEAFTSPEGTVETVFNKAQKKDLTYVGRFSGYVDITESANMTVGANYAIGPAGEEYNLVADSSSTLRSRVHGIDLTLRWKNPRRAIYRSAAWRTELYWIKRELSLLENNKSMGLFSHIEYQFARRWQIGGRWDYTQAPSDKEDLERGGLVYIAFSPSEFNRISLQGRRVIKSDGEKENLGFLKVTFNIGPHGSHPF